MEKDIRKKMYIKIFYSLLDWEWISYPNTLSVFIHLLLNANRKPRKFGNGEIKVGEVLASYSFLAEQTGLSIQQVRTAIDHLISTNDITHRLINNTNVFTIVSFNKWQSGNMNSNNSSTTEQHPDNNTITSEQQPYNNLSTTPIYCKNEEIEDNGIMKECEEIPHAHGRLGNVFLTEKEYKQFVSDYPLIAEKVIDELSVKIATGDGRYKKGHIGHLYIFARNYTEEKSETESKPSFDIELAMKRSLMIDPTKTKRNQ